LIFSYAFRGASGIVSRISVAINEALRGLAIGFDPDRGFDWARHERVD